MLYSSDAFGLPELYFLAALLFRRGLSRACSRTWWAPARPPPPTPIGSSALILHQNARRVYRLGPASAGLSRHPSGWAGARAHHQRNASWPPCTESPSSTSTGGVSRSRCRVDTVLAVLASLGIEADDPDAAERR